MCKYIFTELYPLNQFDIKDQLIMEYLRSMYYLISWFYTKREPKIEDVNHYFSQFASTNFD
jgi:hypothetical protein